MTSPIDSPVNPLFRFALREDVSTHIFQLVGERLNSEGAPTATLVIAQLAHDNVLELPLGNYTAINTASDFYDSDIGGPIKVDHRGRILTRPPVRTH